MTFPEVLDEDTGLAVPVQIGRPTLSPSALGAYEICGRRGQYYQDPNIPKGPPNLNMARGSAWHAALEYANTIRLERETSTDLYDPKDLAAGMLEGAMGKVATETLDRITSDPDFTLEPNESVGDAAWYLNQMLLTYLTAEPGDRWALEKVRLVDKEMHLFIPDFGLTHDFNGYADAVYDVDGITGHIGVDYKATSKAWGGDKAKGDPRKLLQAPLYAESYERLTGIPMDWFAFDVMTIAGKFQRVWVPTNPTVRKPFLERWHQMTETINLHHEAGQEMPTNPGHILCSAKWCPFFDKICPMGSQLDEHLTTAYKTTKGATP